MQDKKIRLSISCTLNNTLGCIKKIPWILGKHAFIVILSLVILSALFGVLLFYNCIFLVRISNPRITESSATFKTDIYQGILKDWQTRDQNLQNIQTPTNF